MNNYEAGLIVGRAEARATILDRDERIAELEAQLAAPVAAQEPVKDLCLALEDMLSGWKYIRQSHGDLYGVGWDRAQDKAEAALAKAYAASQPAQGERQPSEPVLLGGQRAWCAFKSKFCCATPIRCHESGNCANRA